jgi:hypothetical protein
VASINAKLQAAVRYGATPILSQVPNLNSEVSMQQDPTTREVTHMNPNEIAFFVMYRTQAVSPGGLTRDELPYTTEFDALRHHYNTQCREHLSEHQFWGLLK